MLRYRFICGRISYPLNFMMHGLYITVADLWPYFGVRSETSRKILFRPSFSIFKITKAISCGWWQLPAPVEVFLKKNLSVRSFVRLSACPSVCLSDSSIAILRQFNRSLENKQFLWNLRAAEIYAAIKLVTVDTIEEGILFPPQKDGHCIVC